MNFLRLMPGGSMPNVIHADLTEVYEVRTHRNVRFTER